MSDLRKAVVKLAHEKPELRPYLLPLLRQAGDVEDSYDRKLIKDSLDKLGEYLARLNPERTGGIYAPLHKFQYGSGDSWTDFTIEGYFYDRDGMEHSFLITLSTTYEEGLLGADLSVDKKSKYSTEVGQSSIVRELKGPFGKILQRYFR